MPARPAGGPAPARVAENWKIEVSNVLLYGGVVQLVRMPACHAGGREFESRRHRKRPNHCKILQWFSFF